MRTPNRPRLLQRAFPRKLAGFTPLHVHHSPDVLINACAFNAVLAYLPLPRTENNAFNVKNNSQLYTHAVLRSRSKKIRGFAWNINPRKESYIFLPLIPHFVFFPLPRVHLSYVFPFPLFPLYFFKQKIETNVINVCASPARETPRAFQLSVSSSHKGDRVLSYISLLFYLRIFFFSVFFCSTWKLGLSISMTVPFFNSLMSIKFRI